MRHVELSWEGGDRFTARGSNGYTLDVYPGSEIGGDPAVARPKDLVLMGLAGCAGVDVADILTRMRVAFSRLTITVTAEEAPEPPMVFRRMHVIFRLWGEAVAVQRYLHAIELSWNKYCGVALTLRPVVEMTWQAELNGAPVGPPAG